jgi:methionine-gamma-lyase
MEQSMAYSNYHKRKIADRDLHPETQMMSYGYDPFLSEGSVKPPVFLTSTFAFRTAEDGAEFFDMVSGRKPLPEGESAGLCIAASITRTSRSSKIVSRCSTVLTPRS